MPDLGRHDRQVRLPEVGPEGQARLSRATVIVREGTAARFEREYLIRAGVGRVEVSARGAPAPFAQGEIFRHDAPRELAAGASRALVRILALAAGGPR